MQYASPKREIPFHLCGLLQEPACGGQNHIGYLKHAYWVFDSQSKGKVQLQLHLKLKPKVHYRMGGLGCPKAIRFIGELAPDYPKVWRDMAKANICAYIGPKFSMLYVSEIHKNYLFNRYHLLMHLIGSRVKPWSLSDVFPLQDDVTALFVSLTWPVDPGESLGGRLVYVSAVHKLGVIITMTCVVCDRSHHKVGISDRQMHNPTHPTQPNDIQQVATQARSSSILTGL